MCQILFTWACFRCLEVTLGFWSQLKRDRSFVFIILTLLGLRLFYLFFLYLPVESYKDLRICKIGNNMNVFLHSVD